MSQSALSGYEVAVWCVGVQSFWSVLAWTVYTPLMRHEVFFWRSRVETDAPARLAALDHQ